MARIVAAIAIGLVVGLLGGLSIAKLGLTDPPTELADRAARAAAPTRPEAEAGSSAAPAPAGGPIAASRVVTETGDENAAPASLLARTAEATRDAPQPVKVAGSRTIRGRVLDVDGRPIVGAKVRTGREADASENSSSDGFGGAAPSESLDRAVNRAVARFYSRQSDLREASTDRDGNYAFDGLRDGLWWIAAWCEGFDINARGRGGDDEGDAQVRPDATLDFIATPVIRVPIAVVMPDGSPAARAAIVVTGTGHRKSTRRLSWSAAQDTIALVAGRWQVEATLGDPIEGPSHPEYLASETRSVEIAPGNRPALVTLALKRAAGIRGEVRCSGVVSSSDRIAVKLVRLAAGAAPDLPALARAIESGGRSQKDLRYFFKDLTPGRYLLGVSRHWQGRIVAHAIVDVEQGVVEKDLELPPIDATDCLILNARDADGRVVDDLSFQYEVETENSSSTDGIDGERQPDGSFRFSLDDLFEAIVADLDPSRSTTTGEWPEGTSATLIVTSERLGRKRFDLKPMQRWVDVVFGVPAHLLVTVAGVPGSGREGRIELALVERREDRRSHPPWSTESGDELSADQTASFGPIDPGEFEIQIVLRHSRQGNSWKSVIATTPITLAAGENRVTVAMPALYSLTVEVPVTAEDRWVQCYRKDSESDSTSMGEETVDADRHARFEDLPEGLYDVSCGAESMSVRVPVSGPVHLQSKPLNALRVSISNVEGRLSRAGFLDDDVIHRVDGARFDSAVDLEKAIGASLSNKSIVFTVERNGHDVELTIDCTAFTNPFELGGEFEHTVH